MRDPTIYDGGNVERPDERGSVETARRRTSSNSWLGESGSVTKWIRSASDIPGSRFPTTTSGTEANGPLAHRWAISEGRFAGALTKTFGSSEPGPV
jgi:hypothetical protein